MTGFAAFWDSFVNFGLEAFGRYYSIYRATCVSNEDPQKQGRIKVEVTALGRKGALIDYAYPITPYGGKDMGMFFPPEAGDQVYVMFENGNPRIPMYLGGWWMKGDLPSSFQKSPPTVRGIETKSGHKILFDDSPATPGITVETSAGHKMLLSDKPAELGITLETAAGAIVKLDDTQQTITIAKQEGAPPLIQINAAGQIMLFTPFASQAFVLGTTFINDYLQHKHPDPQGGVTGPPIPSGGLYTSFNIFGQ